MKLFIKIYSITLVILCFVFLVCFYSYSAFLNPENIIADYVFNYNNIEMNKRDKEYIEPYMRAIEDSKRINILLVGLENNRSDTIMVLSYDVENNIIDLISVPRDTYYKREGYTDSPDLLKINATYQSPEGIKALEEAVQDLLNIPIHRYITVDYEAVKVAVDTLGGIEVNIPFHMKYDDDYSNPPLHIDFKQGPTLLNGEDALKYLRFRKGNPGCEEYPRGDIDRIKAQQDFVKIAIKKSLSFKLPNLISEVFKYVDTDFSLTEITGLATNAIGFSPENLNTYTIPGKASKNGLWYYYVDKEDAIKLSYDLYGINYKN